MQKWDKESIKNPRTIQRVLKFTGQGCKWKKVLYFYIHSDN